MSLSSMQKKVSGVLVTSLVALIIISFLFQSYQSRRGSVDTIAKVDDTTISVSEFQTAYNRQLQMYAGYMGGKDLTTAQIKQFGIKRQVMSSLISQALIRNFGKELGYTPAPNQISQTIKDIAMFKTSEQFDFKKYKAILQANRMTPAIYEEMVKKDLLQTGVQTLIKTFPLSEQYVSDLNKFKKQQAKATIITFTKEGLKPAIVISDKEITTFLGEKKNEEKAKNIFKDRKKEFTKEEMVKVRHILKRVKANNDEIIMRDLEKLKKKLTPKNFSKIANKQTDDPSGKGKGGDLPEFKRGMMAKEFEAAAFSMKKGEIKGPIKTSFGYHIIYKEGHKAAKVPTFEKYKNKIVTDYLRDQETTKLDEITAKVTKELEALLKDGKTGKISKLKKQYNLTIVKDKTVNRLDGIQDAPGLTPEKIKALFDLKPGKNNISSTSNAGKVAIIKTAFITEKDKEKDKKKDKNKKVKNEDFEMEGQSLIMARKVSGELLEKLKESSSIKDYGVI